MASGTLKDICRHAVVPCAVLAAYALNGVRGRSKEDRVFAAYASLLSVPLPEIGCVYALFYGIKGLASCLQCALDRAAGDSASGSVGGAGTDGS